MIKGIYIAREDGDYDFVAAFAIQQPNGVPVDDVLDYAKHCLDEGEEVIVKDFKDLEHLTDVIESWEAKFEKKL